MERLIDRITDAQIPLLEAHLLQEREADLRGDTSATIRLSGGFHLLLAELAGSNFLFGILRDLISRSSLITAIYRSQHLHNCGPDEHAALIARIGARDKAGAMQIMLDHLQHVEDELDLTEEIPTTRDLRQALV
jgi:DNA-binding GntR family transcriptional regulator